MKRVLLIVAIFLIFDCCWARKLDGADRFLLERNRAISFLFHKRALTCAYYSNLQEGVSEAGTVWEIDFHEECCAESCDTEEVDENINQWHYSTESNSESKREFYVSNCC